VKTRLAVLCGAVLCAVMIGCSTRNASAFEIVQEFSVQSIAFSPDGKVLAAGGGGVIEKRGEVVLWDAHTGVLLRKLTGHSDFVKSIAFSPDGKTLASGSKDETVILWDTQTGEPKRTLTGHRPWVGAVAFSPDGETLASASWGGTVRLWDVDSGLLVRTQLKHPHEATAVTFSPHGAMLASWGGNFPATVQLWDAQTGELLHTLEGHADPRVEAVAFSPDGNTLASAGNILDQTGKLWDTQTGNLKQTLPVVPASHIWPKMCAYSLAFSPDGRFLALGCADRTVKLLSAETGQLLQTLKWHLGSVQAVAFSPDSKTLASGCFYRSGWSPTAAVLSGGREPTQDDTLMLWDLSALQPLPTPVRTATAPTSPEPPESATNVEPAKAQAEQAAVLVEEALAAKREGRLDEAEAKLYEAIELDADNVRAHWVLAWTLVALEREPEAVGEFRIVVELAPEGEMKQQAEAALERMK